MSQSNGTFEPKYITEDVKHLMGEAYNYFDVILDMERDTIVYIVQNNACDVGIVARSYDEIKSVCEFATKKIQFRGDEV